MPVYEIEHVVSLTIQQKDEIAQAITATHTSLFTTPSLFVNVRFTNTSNQDIYVGGKKRPTNRILAYVRPGGGRSDGQFDELCNKLRLIWATHATQPDSIRSDDWDLRIFVLGSIVAGSEGGLPLPKVRFRIHVRNDRSETDEVLVKANRLLDSEAGGDTKWIKDNLEIFKTRAGNGDQDYMDLLEELRCRSDLHT